MLIIRKVSKITSNKFGFSLVELLVVISIISILAAVLVANLTGARERARDSKKIEELGSLKNALRMYYNDNQEYPAGSGITAFSGADLSEMEKYLPAVNSIGFTYYQTNNGDGFNLCTSLDSGAGDDDINSQIKCGMKSTNLVCNIGTTQDKLYVVCAN
jgi:prepilin-type N-terminal cleavage/methylation domain-containing protein